MTATQTSSTAADQVGDLVQRTDTTTVPGRIGSTRRRENGVDYVAGTIPHAGTGDVVTSVDHDRAVLCCARTGRRRVAMTTDSHEADRLCWTALGVQMGFTSGHPQREEILDAIDRMTWIQTPAGRSHLDGQAARAIVSAVVHHGRDRMHLVGSAPLAGGRQLIGLDDGLGTRSYLHVVKLCPRPGQRGDLRARRVHPRPHRPRSLAYVDRATVDAHLERTLSDVEWEAVSGQFTALDFDEHVGDHGIVRTDWIETLLDKATVPGGGPLDRYYGPCSAASATARAGSCPRS